MTAIAVWLGAWFICFFLRSIERQLTRIANHLDSPSRQMERERGTP